MSKSKNKRGSSTCKKKFEGEDYKIELDENMIPVGYHCNDFAKWFGSKLRAEFSYHIPTEKFEKTKWENFWRDVKLHWNIKEDGFKHIVIARAKKYHTDHRSYLNRKYVQLDLRPDFNKRDCVLDQRYWEEFVAEKKSEQSLEKSKKTSKSAKQQRYYTSLGRHGMAQLNVEDIWKQLKERYDNLQEIEDGRSKSWICARVKKDRKTGLYFLHEEIEEAAKELASLEKQMIADGTYDAKNNDPLTFFLGKEHEGRSRTVSNVLAPSKVKGGLFKGRKRKVENEESTTERRGFSDVSSALHVTFPPILDGGVEDNLVNLVFDRATLDQVEVNERLDISVKHVAMAGITLASSSQQSYLEKDKYNGTVSPQEPSQPPVVKKVLSKEEEKEGIMKVKELVSYIKKNRDVKFKTLCSHLMHFSEGKLSLNIAPVNGMYPVAPRGNDSLSWFENVQVSMLLTFLRTGDWLDNNIVHLAQMYLHTIPLVTIAPGATQQPTQTANFCANLIMGTWCDNNPQLVEKHLQAVSTFHKEKNYFLAPFLEGEHWVLFIVCPKLQSVYILDSLKGTKNKDSYALTARINKVFLIRHWEMVNCKQETSGWECGFMVIKHMFEFWIFKQFYFPQDIWNTMDTCKQDDIDELVTAVMPRLLYMCFSNHIERKNVAN